MAKSSVEAATMEVKHVDTSTLKPTLNKRLIVLCDGTGQSSISANSKTYLTNITRLSRALSPYAVVGDKEIQQVIYYQPGVGTEAGQTLSGGLAGVGVEENVRAAYAFLAHNYIKGDQIYFFGFSRGAFTARLIAGLVTELGVLTKRGMDQFPLAYKTFKAWVDEPDETKSEGAKARREFEAMQEKLRKYNVIHESGKEAVQIVGVFDTVAFYAEGRLSEWLRGEPYKLKDASLSPKVTYGYHALALDEERRPFQPTLWTWPRTKSGELIKDGRLKEMRQVWFSGAHSDIGGGLEDPRLSDIALVWMISRCSGEDKLAFIDVPPSLPLTDGQSFYLLDPAKKTPTKTWATEAGSNMQSWMGFSDMMASLVENVGHGPRPPPKTQEDPENGCETHEYIHRSIRERKLNESLPLTTSVWRYVKSITPWGHDVSSGYAAWPCKIIQPSGMGILSDFKKRVLAEDTNTEFCVGADEKEDLFRGRIRRLPLPMDNKDLEW